MPSPHTKPLLAADLFCGAGGTSSGLLEASAKLGRRVNLTAVNHWTRAIETHSLNHPGARHYCASIDTLNPRQLFNGAQLDLLWASPECTHHSRARGGKPLNDQSRATAWCVTRWAEALRPHTILVENVPEFTDWGGLGHDGRPLKSKKGATFRAWIATLESLGYRVGWRILCAADYGDPTTRRRLFVQAVRGRRNIVWPDPTHLPEGADLTGDQKHWTPARQIIDSSLPSTSIYSRKKPLAPKTMQRIAKGLTRLGLSEPFIVELVNNCTARSISTPLTTVRTSGSHHALCEPMLLPQQSAGRPRPVSEPAPTIATAGAIALIEPYLISYYGNGDAQSINTPLGTVTTKDRFGLAQPTLEIEGKHYTLDIKFRMLQPHELAAAQGFPPSYQFAGNKTEITKQIGNAVPRRLARAICLAAISQDNRISRYLN